MTFVEKEMKKKYILIEDSRSLLVKKMVKIMLESFNEMTRK